MKEKTKKIFKRVAFVYFILFLIVYFVGLYGIYTESGIREVFHVMSPFNWIGWIVNIILLSPAFLLYYFSEK